MKTRIFIFAAALFLSLPGLAQNDPVKIWEGTIDFPAYRVNPTEKAHLFERDFAYQMAKRSVYPYAMNDNPTYDRMDSTHMAVFQENYLLAGT